jgi:hypothetical protein
VDVGTAVVAVVAVPEDAIILDADRQTGVSLVVSFSMVGAAWTGGADIVSDVRCL